MSSRFLTAAAARWPVDGISALLLANRAQTPLAEIRRLIIKDSLDRFLIERFVELEGDLVGIPAQLWRQLRISDPIELQAAVQKQLRTSPHVHATAVGRRWNS